MFCKTWKMLPDLDKLDQTSGEKIGQKLFFRRRDSLSWKLFLMTTLLLQKRSYILLNARKCHKTSWNLIKNFLTIGILGNTRRKKLKFFSLECLQIFLFSKSSVFNNLSGLWELTFLLATIWLEFFVERDKTVMDVCKTRYYEKKCINDFFTGKVTLFRKFLFPTFTQLLQKWSCNLQKNCLNIFCASGIASWCRDTQ